MTKAHTRTPPFIFSALAGCVGLAMKTCAVVGSGCAGLACAHALAKAGVRVTLYESDAQFGGHARTMMVEGVPVDVGFMVCNRVTYPNMVRAERRRDGCDNRCTGRLAARPSFLRATRASLDATLTVRGCAVLAAGLVRGVGRGGGGL